MSSDTTTTPTSHLTPADRVRAFRILGRTPYAAGLRAAVRDPQEMTVEGLLDALAELSGRLVQHGEECAARDAELRRHQDLILGGRRLLAELLPAAPAAPAAGRDPLPGWPDPDARPRS
ncbi:hypothetical protein AB0F93_00515 [Micromonospora tulbaghiae]|uniref:hypothetical protein n=1 Tax=Micromonospora tulbaghiae TaxID=479978 RepID=UPI00332EB698